MLNMQRLGFFYRRTFYQPAFQQHWNALRRFSTARLVTSSNLVDPNFRKQCGWWLIGCSGLVAGMTMLGGYTRLKRAGLSMTEWSFSGEGFPRNDSEWDRQFDKYMETPEYKKVHNGLSLEEFKTIYFIEWFHRMAGRLTGLVFASGSAYFIANRALSKFMIFRLGGGVQGLIGWWMVKSGLINKEHPRVSGTRLVTHLGLAVGLYSALLWNGLNLIRPVGTLFAHSADISIASRNLARINSRAKLLGLFVFCTLMSGGLVAGIDAGHAYNTWPKMLDRWVPQEFESITTENWLQKITEDTGIVQFNHRVMAYLTLFFNSALFLYTRRLNVPQPVKFAAHLLPAMTGIQLVLGIGTLMMSVPTYMGVLHQGGGLLTLSTVLYLIHCTRQPHNIAKLCVSINK